MDRESLRAFTIAVIGIVAVGLSAATISQTTDEDELGGNGGGAPDLGPDERADPGAALDVGPFLEVIGTILVIVAIIYLVYALVYHTKQTLIVAAVVLVLLGLLFAVVEYGPELQTEPEEEMEEIEDFDDDPFDDGDGEGPGEDGEPSVPTIVLYLLLLLAALITVLSVVTMRNRTGEEESEDADDGTDSSAAVGRAAGRAADRLERTVDVDNEVYRAWREMTTLLDVERPESSTPGEFAAAAVDAGLSQSDVSELTRLFEAVRYGDRDPEGREEPALAVFRRIEAEYAEEEDEVTPDRAGGDLTPDRTEDER